MATDVTGFERRRRKEAQHGPEEEKETGAGETGPAEGSETETEPQGLEEKTVKELQAIAKDAGVKNYGRLRKAELVEALRG